MKSILMFISGAIVGAGVSWVYHKNKYEEMVQEEVELLRYHAKNKNNIVKEMNMQDQNKVKEEFDQSMIEDAEEIINKNKYNSSTKDSNLDKAIQNVVKQPFIVTPEDFATVQGFDTDSFYYCANDVIVNDRQEMVEDVEQILGLTTEEIKDQFGVYEDEAVYIRNEMLKCDYEILKDNEDYVKKEW